MNKIERFNCAKYANVFAFLAQVYKLSFWIEKYTILLLILGFTVSSCLLQHKHCQTRVMGFL
jgi:hypothetical protein